MTVAQAEAALVVAAQGEAAEVQDGSVQWVVAEHARLIREPCAVWSAVTAFRRRQCHRPALLGVADIMAAVSRLAASYGDIVPPELLGNSKTVSEKFGAGERVVGFVLSEKICDRKVA